MENVIYRVEINTSEYRWSAIAFEFIDVDDAMAFAKKAVRSYVCSDDEEKKTLNVTINMVPIKLTTEENQEDK